MRASQRATGERRLVVVELSDAERLDARAVVNWLSACLPKPVSRLAAAMVTWPARAGLRLWELMVISAALQVGRSR